MARHFVMQLRANGFVLVDKTEHVQMTHIKRQIDIIIKLTEARNRSGI